MASTAKAIVKALTKSKSSDFYRQHFIKAFGSA